MPGDPDTRAYCEDWLREKGASDVGAFAEWLDNAELRHYPRGDLIVAAGTVDSRIYLIRSGLVRLFYLSSEGKERNKAFYAEGTLVGAMSSAILDGQASFSIEALENTEVVAGDYQTFFSRAGSETDRARVVLNLLTDAFVRNEQREAVLLTLTAEQRYRWLMTNESWLVDRVPQFHLASYLAMDAVTLSRLKKSFTS